MTKSVFAQDSTVGQRQIYRFDSVEKILYEASSRAHLYNDADFIFALTSRLDSLMPDEGVLSLDIFDTLLLRDNSSELRRFLEVGGCMALLAPGSTPVDAFLARYLATKASYRAGARVNGCGEGSLSEIHRTASRLLGWGDSLTEKFVEAELQHESCRMSVNQILIEYSIRHRQRGGLVILVSDMYMHASQIKVLLEKLGVDNEIFHYIVSSADTKLSKGTGGIFALIGESLGVESSRFLHVGDSIKGDFVNPRAAGWRSLHLPIPRIEVDERRRDHLETAQHLQRAFNLAVDIALPK